MKQTHKKNLIFGLFLTVHAFIGFALNAMEEKKDSLDEIPSHCRYKETPIELATIGKLAMEHALPAEKAAIVKEWRDSNIGLVKKLVDFSFPNSEMRSNVLANRELLKEQGLDSQSAVSYTFALPINENPYFHVGSQYYRLHNLRRYHGHDWNFGRDDATGQVIKEKIDTLEKAPTYQTVSDFINYLQLSETAENNNFNNFSAPATYLVPVEDNQPLESYNDDNTFIIQDRLTRPVTPLCDKNNPQRISDIPSTALNELLVGINAVGLWDSSKFLVDEDNKLHIISLRQPDCSNPSDFHNKNEDSGFCASFSFNVRNGFKGLYNFCKETNNTETQNIIRNFVEKNVTLPSQRQQAELFNELDI